MAGVLASGSPLNTARAYEGPEHGQQNALSKAAVNGKHVRVHGHRAAVAGSATGDQGF